MICPTCQAEGSVTTFARMMIDTDGRSRDYRAWLRCGRCRTCYFGRSEEYFFDDDFVFSLYGAEAAGWELSLARALECPRKEDPDCKCAAHTNPPEGMGTLISYTPTYYPKDYS